MSLVQYKIKNPLFSLKKINTWLKSSYGLWTKRIILWTVFTYFVRYFVVENFYKDNAEATIWLSIGQVVQTICLYYIFGHYVFPKYVYSFRLAQFLLWFFLINLIIYLSNYLLFWYLQQINTGIRIERDWTRLHEAGILGLFTDGSLAFWSFGYSSTFAILFLPILAIKDIILLRTKNLILEKDKLMLELTFLKAQVNPHFLFNTLNAIYSDVFDTNEKAADLILRLSELMRYNLYETDQPKIALDKELDYVRNYLDLERNRFSDQYVVIDYEQSGQPGQYQIAPLLLIVFVENAFKHGIKGAIEPAYVQVGAEVTADQIVFRVENSIPYKHPVDKVEKRSGGIGLGNVRRRLDILYNGQYELVIDSNEAVHKVTLKVRVEALSQSIIS